MGTFLHLMNGGAGSLAAYLAAHVLLCLLPAFFIACAMTALITKATDMKAIMAYDLISIPGLVIHEKLVSNGRIPTQAEIRQWMQA
jgi:Thioredoxin domain